MTMCPHGVSRRPFPCAKCEADIQFGKRIDLRTEPPAVDEFYAKPACRDIRREAVGFETIAIYTPSGQVQVVEDPTRFSSEALGWVSEKTWGGAGFGMSSPYERICDLARVQVALADPLRTVKLHPATFKALQEDLGMRLMPAPITDIQREEREKSMRATIAAEVGNATGEWSSFRLQFRDACAIKAPDGRYLVVPTEALPRVVRELAELMTEEQRAALCRLTLPSGWTLTHKNHAPGLDLTLDPQCPAGTGFIFETPKALDLPLADAMDVEGGAGISSLPEKSETLAFLDEDLLADDA